MRRIARDSLATVTLHVNGRPYRAAIEARMLLSDFLRSCCGLTGTHVGCEHGVCGACTVLVNGQAMRSCILLAISLHDAEITTIEGLARHPAFPEVYGAFTEHHALQCGFCTPGIVATVMAEVLGQHKSDEELVELLSGHLCRCTGYLGIKAACQQLTTARWETGDARRAARGPDPGSPPPTAYRLPPGG
jgi:aerobic-type carbon monoxide dehydrogenase small subunit (CoxS/CutS family)